MNRRDVLVGLSGLVGAGAFASGTGAFSAAEITRESSITVVDDSQGLVGLVPNEEIAGVQTNSNELSIILGTDDEPGVNVNSVYQFGKFFTDYGVESITGDTFSVVTSDDPADLSAGQDSLESAFAVVNQSPQDLDVTLTFDLDDEMDGDTEYAFELQSSKGGAGSREGKTMSPIRGGSLTGTLAIGESFGVSFIVNALDGLVSDEISGSLSISATPA